MILDAPGCSLLFLTTHNSRIRICDMCVVMFHVKWFQRDLDESASHPLPRQGGVPQVCVFRRLYVLIQKSLYLLCLEAFICWFKGFLFSLKPRRCLSSASRKVNRLTQLLVQSKIWFISLDVVKGTTIWQIKADIFKNKRWNHHQKQDQVPGDELCRNKNS